MVNALVTLDSGFWVLTSGLSGVEGLEVPAFDFRAFVLRLLGHHLQGRGLAGHLLPERDDTRAAQVYPDTHCRESDDQDECADPG